MNIVSHNSYKLISENGNSCCVHVMHVKICDIDRRAKEMIDTILNTSWINKLSVVDQISYSARAERTINKLVNDIFMKVSSPVSTEFGEYMISMSAQDALKESACHKVVPLAEMFKERMSGNSGFDFHTETPTSYLAFGEAKYSGRSTPYEKALVQISDFITLKKDEAELIDLKHFCSKKAVDRVTIGEKAFIAAFSLNVKNIDKLFARILAIDEVAKLLIYPELYLIGVEVCDCES